MIKVKICGITNLEDALAASRSGADAVGFIFSKKSLRCVSKEKAQKIIRNLDPFLVKAGVFLDQNRQEVLNIAESLNLEVLQFHGKETAAYCHSFRPRFKVIKVFFPGENSGRKNFSRYKVDAFMFDMRLGEKVKGRKVLPAAALKEAVSLIKNGRRVIISGGLNINNLEKVKRLNPYALDVASGVEKMVGIKDGRLVKAFIKKVKYAAA